MRGEGWRGKGKHDVSPVVIQMRRSNTMQRYSFGMGGLPRRKKAPAISLPKLKCLETEVKR